ncbi:MAG: murein biosynthesis integral membrane protein MurJ [Anaerolineaceae bacterium]|nr:murein biosynthesis integral membrane protein MurJ [Anaerolineaceae bacterium]
MMKKLSHLTRISLLLTAFFAVDKVVALLRQVVINRQFGLSLELDAFNAANNLPDLLYALISGGALSIAFIPVLSEVLARSGHKDAWKLFSRVANLAFLDTLAFSIIFALLADHLVGWKLGVAPGFTGTQQHLVANLMRLNLIATLIFSISGLVMAGLQTNQHFLLPALAPILYNLGQIIGATILAPDEGISIGPVSLPAFGFGISGLVYGVILGAILHIAIQIPALVKYHFRWTVGLGIKSVEVRKVLYLMGPRVMTMMFIQFIFLARDNLASIFQGGVTLLTNAWMLLQVPETLIGTAIGTALLPTLSEQYAHTDHEGFQGTVQRASHVLVAITFPVAAILAAGMRPALGIAFQFGEVATDQLQMVFQAFLVGLTANCLIEVAARGFYARQNALIPLLVSFINAILFTSLAILFRSFLDVTGIALAISISYTCEAILLFLLMKKSLSINIVFGNVFVRACLAALTGGGVCWFVMQIPSVGLMSLLLSMGAMFLGLVAAVPFIRRELSLLIKL